MECIPRPSHAGSLIGGIGTVLIALIGKRVFPELLRIDTLERS